MAFGHPCGQAMNSYWVSRSIVGISKIENLALSAVIYISSRWAASGVLGYGSLSYPPGASD